MEERRKTKRFATNLKAQYFLKERKEGRECTVINISRSGVGLEFYTAEEVVAGSTLLIKISTAKSLETTEVEGIVKWVTHGEKDFVSGIEATSQLDEERLASLIALTLGL